MNITQWIAAGLLVAAPAAALAQQAPGRAAATDPDAAVPAPVYNSAFEHYPTAVASDEVTPDKAWRSANAQAAGEEAAPVDHSKMDHSKMNHSTMDHSKMDHGKMDHSKMDHSRHTKQEGKE